jgi:hypothetical protein
LAAELQAAVGWIAEDLDPSQEAFVGSLREDDQNDVRRLVKPATRQRLERVLSQVQGSESSCGAVGILLPAGAEYIGFRYQAGERGVFAECGLGKECQLREARWIETPILTTTDSVTLVHAVFENLSTRRERTARLVVYFKPAPGWLPPN